MSGDLGFDSSKVKKDEPVPEGWHRALISKAERKETKSGSGAYIALTYQILDGPHKNRVVNQNVNLWNTNPQAKAIAERELKSICDALGIVVANNMSDLMMKPLMVKVKHSEYNGETRGEVRGTKKIEAGATTEVPAGTTGGPPVGW